MNEPLSSTPRPAPSMNNWVPVLLRGLIGVVFGLTAILLPGPTLAALVLLFSAYLLVDGVFAIWAGLRAIGKRERWGWLVLQGVVNIVAAAVGFFWPGLTVFVFVWVIGFWALVSGAFMLAAATRVSREHGRWWLVLGGLVSIAWGALLLVETAIGALVIALWIGVYALVFGITLLPLAFRLRRMQARVSENPGP